MMRARAAIMLLLLSLLLSPEAPEQQRERFSPEALRAPLAHIERSEQRIYASRPVGAISERLAEPPAARPSRRKARSRASSGSEQSALASWYGERPAACYDRSGGRTTRHEMPSQITRWTAHRTLPCGTLVRMHYQGREIIVPVWDRGPYCCGRSFDLSRAAFEALAISLGKGEIRITWSIIPLR